MHIDLAPVSAERLRPPFNWLQWVYYVYLLVVLVPYYVLPSIRYVFIAVYCTYSGLLVTSQFRGSYWIFMYLGWVCTSEWRFCSFPSSVYCCSLRFVSTCMSAPTFRFSLCSFGSVLHRWLWWWMTDGRRGWCHIFFGIKSNTFIKCNGLFSRKKCVSSSFGNMGRDYFQTLTGLLVITCWWLFWCMECEGWNLSDVERMIF